MQHLKGVKTCQKCGESNLNWFNQNGFWVLCNAKGMKHHCKPKVEKTVIDGLVEYYGLTVKEGDSETKILLKVLLEMSIKIEALENQLKSVDTDSVD